MSFSFDNRFLNELPGESETEIWPRQVHDACWSPVTPTPVSGPKLLAYSPEMAKELEFSKREMISESVLGALSGNSLLPGMQPYSMCYGGHQFGNWAGQLGDGRAINLGEGANAQGKRWVLQLKGAGPTPYSRRADGRAVLRSSVREFVCSEAMHHLGVPTTRALSLVSTGDTVMRDMFYDGRPAHEPGAIVCRVSPSFVRFGNFEIFASRGEDEVLKQLTEFVMARDFPELEGEGDAKLINFFSQVCERTALMVSHWMRVGFVHGVMNTDNMSIMGLTIDYGPYGWIDDYDPNWTPNTTDLPRRRYRFGQQPQIAQWNLLRLANALAALMEEPQSLQAGFERYATVYEERSMEQTYQKFGLPSAGDPEDERLMAEGYDLLASSEADMTLFFRTLADLSAEPELSEISGIFYSSEKMEQESLRWVAWLKKYASRLTHIGKKPEDRRREMNSVNPLYVPRNYLLQEAIELAESGDLARVEELMEVFRRPYEAQEGKEHFSARRPEWAREKPGCSTLSCSS